jgi:membrane-associated protease RseP (regulator of RpoE activity)
MSRFPTLLLAAAVCATPFVAVAAPAAKPHSEQFSWSMSTGRGRLGIAIIGLTPELRAHFGAASDRGVLVAHVEPDSPAVKAGIEVGDVIASVGGHPAAEASDVLGALADIKKGQTVDVDVIRDLKPVALKATMADDPMPFEAHRGWPDARWFDEMFDRQWPSLPPPATGKTSTTS